MMPPEVELEHNQIILDLFPSGYVHQVYLKRREELINKLNENIVQNFENVLLEGEE